MLGAIIAATALLAVVVMGVLGWLALTGAQDDLKKSQVHASLASRSSDAARAEVEAVRAQLDATRRRLAEMATASSVARLTNEVRSDLAQRVTVDEQVEMAREVARRLDVKLDRTEFVAYKGAVDAMLAAKMSASAADELGKQAAAKVDSARYESELAATRRQLQARLDKSYLGRFDAQAALAAAMKVGLGENGKQIAAGSQQLEALASRVASVEARLNVPSSQAAAPVRTGSGVSPQQAQQMAQLRVSAQLAQTAAGAASEGALKEQVVQLAGSVAALQVQMSGASRADMQVVSGAMQKYSGMLSGSVQFSRLCFDDAGTTCLTDGDVRYLKAEQVRPADCVLGDWTAWGECSKTCGGGTQARSRPVARKDRNGGAACPADTDPRRLESRACNTQTCVVNCVPSAWSEWSACSNDGVQRRTRTIVTPAQNGGASCEPLAETQPCKVNCATSDWGAWGACVNGVRRRTRTVTRQPRNGGDACGPLEEAQSCPVDCAGQWTYTSCTRSCGGGTRTARYDVTRAAQNGGAPCPFSNGFQREESCNTHSCPVDCEGYWGLTNFGQCSAPCGGGVRTLAFTVTKEAQNGGACPNRGATRTESCNTQSCSPPPPPAYSPPPPSYSAPSPAPSVSYTPPPSSGSVQRAVAFYGRRGML